MSKIHQENKAGQLFSEHKLNCRYELFRQRQEDRARQSTI